MAVLSNSGNGCNAHDDCFTCPFRLCRYDMTAAQFSTELKRLEALRTAKRVWVLTETGIGSEEAAQQVADSLGYTKRTVFRHIFVANKLKE